MGADGSPVAKSLTARRARTPKTSELIAREIVDHIIDGNLADGDRLPAEHEMVAQLGVSRATVREALRLLETRGAIIVKAGRNGGPIVRRPRGDDLGEALTLILQFEGATMADVIQARLAFEPMIARQAATRAKSRDVDQLAATVTAMREHPADQALFLEQNHIFHARIAEIGGNPILRILTETLKSLADGAIVGIRAPQQRRLEVACAHDSIVEALRAGDPDAAEAAMHAHLDEANRYWLKNYGPLVRRPITWLH